MRLVALRLASIGTVLALWEWASGRIVEPWVASSPSAIALSLYEFFTSGEIWPHLWASLSALAIGFPIGIASGIVLGYLLGRHQVLSELFEPLIMALYGTPKIALAPLFILWFGIGVASKIALVVLLSFFFNFFNTYAGVRQFDEDYLKFARLMGAHGPTLIGRVMLPAISPAIMTGIRASVPLAFIGVIVAEFIAARAGLGLVIRNAVQMFDTPRAFAAVVLLLACILALNEVVRLVETKTLTWLPRREPIGTGA